MKSTVHSTICRDGKLRPKTLVPSTAMRHYCRVCQDFNKQAIHDCRESNCLMWSHRPLLKQTNAGLLMGIRTPGLPLRGCTEEHKARIIADHCRHDCQECVSVDGRSKPESEARECPLFPWCHLR